MSELLELTGSELDAVGGGFLNTNSITFNNTGGAGGAGAVLGGAGGAGGNVVVGAEIGQQFNLASFNGILQLS